MSHALPFCEEVSQMKQKSKRNSRQNEFCGIKGHLLNGRMT